MHVEAYDWVAESFRGWRDTHPGVEYKVLEIGSLDINGSVRPLFEDAEYYLGIDMQEGPGVDLVAKMTISPSSTMTSALSQVV